MSLYLCHVHYTPEAFRGMVAKPEDRLAPVKTLFETAGMKLLHTWFSPSTFETIVIVFAAWPLPLRANSASGSLGDTCVSFVRRSP